MQATSIARALATAALLCGCERAEPAAPRTPEPAPVSSSIEAPAPEGVPIEAPEVPQLDPKLPAQQIELTPPPAKATRSNPRTHHSQDVAAATAEPAASAVEHPPLDVLLRAPDLPPAEEPSTVEFGAPEAPPKRIEPKPPGTLDRLGQSIRLEGRKEAIGPAGPRQGTLTETEAGLRIPVDSSISLEGGVRVDSREEPGAKQADRRSTPRVGVEFRF